MTPPAVIQFNASNVPVVQMTLSSPSLTEQEISDYALNFIRVRLFTIPGLSTPGPFGGKSRQMNVALDQDRMIAKGFSPVDVVNALQANMPPELQFINEMLNASTDFEAQQMLAEHGPSFGPGLAAAMDAVEGQLAQGSPAIRERFALLRQAAANL